MWVEVELIDRHGRSVRKELHASVPLCGRQAAHRGRLSIARGYTPAVATTTAPDRALLLDGEWLATGEWPAARSPYDGSLVGRVAKGGTDEPRRAVDAAARAMREPLPAHKRAEIL